MSLDPRQAAGPRGPRATQTDPRREKAIVDGPVAWPQAASDDAYSYDRNPSSIREQAHYHDHATLEYPYTLGCFRGTPAT